MASLAFLSRGMVSKNAWGSSWISCMMVSIAVRIVDEQIGLSEFSARRAPEAQMVLKSVTF